MSYGKVTFGKLQSLKMVFSSLDDYTDQYYLLEARARLHETNQQRVSRYKSGLTKKFQEATILQLVFCLVEIVQVAKQANKLHVQYRLPVQEVTPASPAILAVIIPCTFFLGNCYGCGKLGHQKRDSPVFAKKWFTDKRKMALFEALEKVKGGFIANFMMNFPNNNNNNKYGRNNNENNTLPVPQENDAHKIYQGLNGSNNFKHREVYKILAREPRWANLRDDGLNHAVNIPRNVARRTSDNSSLGNSVGINNLSKDPDGPPTPQFAGPNSDLDGSLYEGGSRPISQKLYRKNLASQKAMKGIAASGSGIQIMLDELRLEKIQAKEENERSRAETIQYWQTKIDLEQAKEDRKIMEKDLSTLSGHQLQYYMQR
ncbi:hypothetical protein GIB67_035289 [Kingdonia uniflora]|uniref:No apical meristem-associated C-terminal domain-containing protein n=1 Tax=Kingdonia uniflora TaxID=39325 RepID=A0A7J7KY03_9MAGN|nr:hypothetical protein GIB67_035289 [Kingdonia uniflora]